MILAIDIGGTRTRFALFQMGHYFEAAVWNETIPTIYHYEAFLHKLQEVAQTVHNHIESVGISFGVAFSEDGRVITAAGKMPDFVGRNLITDMEAIFSCKCKVAHDCICAVIAETEVSQTLGHAAYVTVSSGTGGAVLFRNGDQKTVFRTRLAHQIIDKSGPLCHCGQRGCLAAFTDGTEIYKRKQVRPEDIHDEELWQEFTEALAIGLVNLSWMYPVDTITVGGGIALNNPFVHTNLRKYYYNIRVTGKQKPCELQYANFGDQSSLIGACFLVSNRDIIVLY